MLLSPLGGIGRHKGLKIPRLKSRAGSSPAAGTIGSNALIVQFAQFLHIKYDYIIGKVKLSQMNTENNIIKDRIQDVRERFLSGNQIEEIRQNVTSLVNERLDEFQNAQNNAFKELEIAIDKLESHQREMIAYFNKQLLALEEEQKASNGEVLKLASMQNIKVSKSPENTENIISKNVFSYFKKFANNNLLAFLAIVSFLGILALNIF